MTFTATPGSVLAQPANVVPGNGINVHRYSMSFNASIAPTGALTSLYNNVFQQLSVVAFRATGRVLNFLALNRTNNLG